MVTFLFAFFLLSQALVAKQLKESQFENIPTLQNTTKNSSKKKRIIFLDFYNQSKKREYKWIEKSIGNSIEENISKKYKFIKIDAKIWHQYATKNNYRPNDFFDQGKISKMGVELKADGIIYGKFFVSKQQKLIITGKILSVATDEILASKTGTSEVTQKMFLISDKISNYLALNIKSLFVPSNFGAAIRSTALPGWGQFYKGRTKFGYAWSIGLGTSFLTSSILSGIFFYKQANLNDVILRYQNSIGNEDLPALFKEALEMRQSLVSFKNITQVSWIIFSGLYLLNIIDAFIFDGNYSNDVVSFDLNLSNTIVGNSIFLNKPETKIEVIARMRF